MQTFKKLLLEKFYHNVAQTFLLLKWSWRANSFKNLAKLVKNDKSVLQSIPSNTYLELNFFRLY